MRKFIEIITEAERLTGHQASAMPLLGVRTGEFIQLKDWFGDVWAYVTNAYAPDPQSHKQTLTYSRRGKRGERNIQGGRDRGDELIIIGDLLCTDKGSLMKGSNYCKLRKVATVGDLREMIAAGKPLIITMPEFKVDWWDVWKDGEKIGRLDKDAMVHLDSGESFDLFSERSI